jgi:MtrB/PioB family decaheme-associated outer membrane protein
MGVTKNRNKTQHMLSSQRRCRVTWAAPVLLCGLVSWGQVSADSEIGTDSHISNELNVGLAPLGQTVDPLGYSLFSEAAISPSGILYPLLFDPSALYPNDDIEGEDQTGWRFGGAIEFGYLFNFGTTDTASFREFADWDEDPILSRLDIRGYNAQTAEHLNFYGGSIGRDDQYLRLNYGRYGAFEIDAWFNQIPHTFTTNAQVLWDGVGSGNLTLPDGITPGASTAEEVRAVLAERGESTLKLERDRLGFAISTTPWQRVELFVSGLTEWRDGARPFGGTFNYPTLGQSTETVEPINYITHEVDLGFRYLGQTYQANVVYNGSFFFNDTETLVWENPGLSAFVPEFVPERGRYALAPDNRFHQFKGDFSANLPFLNGRWTSTVAYNRKVQDQALLPPTISTGIGNNTGFPIDFDQFNTVEALSQRTSDARIETYFFQGELSLQPTRKLRTTAEFRYVGEDNHTDYTAFNPLTGQFGYISEDGGNIFDDGIYNPSQAGDATRFRNAPYEKDERQLKLKADYRLASRMKLALSYEHLEKDYAFREREDVEDDRFRLQFTDRSGPWASLRVAAEYARRSGDDYILNPLAPLLTSSLEGYVPFFPDGGNPPQELADLRVFDLSSRDQYVGDVQLRFNPNLRSDLGFNVRYERDEFDADFGLQDSERLNASAEYNYQFAKDGSAFVYYSYQNHDRAARNINDAGAFGDDPNAGGVVFPLDNAWRETLNEHNHSAGIGVTKQWRQFLFEADYVFSYARSRVAFDFNSPGALAVPVQPEDAGNNLPLQTYEQHLLRASVRYPITENIATRIFYRLESIQIDDFHYEGLTDPVVDNQLFLLAIPEDFTAHIFGVFMELSF